MDIELDELIGLHVLGGVDYEHEKIKTWGEHYEDCQVMNFQFDGIVYSACEDPDDGYRSSMKYLKVAGGKIKNTFPGQQLMCVKKSNDNFRKNDTLQCVDVSTGKVVLEVGTDNTDDYYPYFVANFNPENMAINQEAP